MHVFAGPLALNEIAMPTGPYSVLTARAANNTTLKAPKNRNYSPWALVASIAHKEEVKRDFQLLRDHAVLAYAKQARQPAMVEPHVLQNSNRR